MNSNIVATLSGIDATMVLSREGLSYVLYVEDHGTSDSAAMHLSTTDLYTLYLYIESELRNIQMLSGKVTNA